jgi:UDP-glucose 4-epimerase
MRDFVYIRDCVRAIIMASLTEEVYGNVLNVGDDNPTTFRELAQIVVEEAGSGCWELSPYTAERRALEPGHFYSDISRIRGLVGWHPETPLREGVRRTIDYYQEHRSHYW